MSTPGPETRWFDIAQVRQAKTSQKRLGMIMGGGFLLLPMGGGFAYIVTEQGASGPMLAGVGCFAVFMIGGIVLLTWWINRQSAAATGSAVERLGVARDGIWCATTQGVNLLPWQGLGGVRIHSVMTGQAAGAAVQVINLDLLRPNQPVIGKQVPGMDTGHHRIHLGDAVGTVSPVAYALARDVGHAIHAYCPSLWRGFTKDSGFGYIEFQSWDSPEQTWRQLGADLNNPTWNNFGGGPPGPGGPHPR